MAGGGGLYTEVVIILIILLPAPVGWPAGLEMVADASGGGQQEQWIYRATVEQWGSSCEKSEWANGREMCIVLGNWLFCWRPSTGSWYSNRNKKNTAGRQHVGICGYADNDYADDDQISVMD